MSQTKSTDTLRFIRCNIGDETYALDMLWVRSIQRVDRLQPNPEADAGASVPIGRLSGNEGDIPVFSLASRLERPDFLNCVPKNNSSQRIVVLNSTSAGEQNTQKQSQAWLVDDVSQVIQIPGSRLMPLPYIAVNPAANYFESVIRLEESLLLLLSPDQIGLKPQLQNAKPQTSEPELEEPESQKNNFAANTQAKSKACTEQSRSIGRIIVFSTAPSQPGRQTFLYGLSVSQVPEILNPLPMIPIPGAFPFVLGLVNWRNYPVPVVDLEAGLGLASSPVNGQSRLIIARGSKRNAFISFPIQVGVRALQLPIAHRPCAHPPAANQTLLKGSMELENALLLIPDIQNILDCNRSHPLDKV